MPDPDGRAAVAPGCAEAPRAHPAPRERLSRGYLPAYTRHIRLQGELVGFVVLVPREKDWLLDHLYIHPSAQAQGIGSWVLDRVLQEADAQHMAVEDDLAAIDIGDHVGVLSACTLAFTGSHECILVVEGKHFESVEHRPLQQGVCICIREPCPGTIDIHAACRLLRNVVCTVRRTSR